MQSMSNRNEQNGRQPPMPTQPAHCDSEFNGENFITNEKKEICKDFVWGKCTKRAKCKFRHELDFEAMKRILVFCHDYQNKTRCTRENCTYLHATKEEENLFLETGQLPRVLAERHSNMSASAAETIPQIALFIQESLAAPPPPPPPPPVPAGAPAPPLPALAPVPLPFVAQRPSCIPLQQMPPPPPPPTVPSAPVMFPWNSLYTGPPHNMAIASTSTASPSFPVFYATRPPPPIQTKNGPLKRKAPESHGPSHISPTASTSAASTSSFPIFDATKPPPPIQAKNGLAKWKPPGSDAHHSKMRKKEEENVADDKCEQCKRRCVRLEEYKQDLEKLQREDEYQSLIYRRKLEDLQNRKEELKSHVSPELFSCINEYIENLPVPHLQDTYSPVFNADRPTTVPRQFLIQLMDFILNTDRHFDSSSSSSNLQRDESLLQMLTQRSSPQNADVLQLIMDILRQSNTVGDRGSTSDINGETLKSLGSSSNENRFHRFSNGQNPQAESSGRVSQTQTQTYAYPPPAPPALPPPVVPAPPPPVPPPTPAAPRLYYPSTYPAPTSGAASTSSSQMNIGSAPPPPATAPPPAPMPPYQLGRYPPPYYPRHQ